MVARSEEFSNALFGSPVRLRLLVSIAKSAEDQLYATQVAGVADVSVSAAAKMLAQLVAFGLLTVAPSTALADRAKRYTRSRSAIWALLIELDKEAIGYVQLQMDSAL